MRKELLAIGTYIAAIIGAGFASGSEIVHYFAIYGKMGFFGIVISSLLFALSAESITWLSKIHNADSFGSLLNSIFPRQAAKIIQICSVVFMFFVFSAMLSGSGEALCQLLGTKKSVGVLIILLFTDVILLFDIRGLMAANGIMSVLIIFGTLFICFYLFNFREIPVFAYNGKWAVSGTLYTGYNILTAGAVLPSMSKYIKSPRRMGLISGICIFILLTAIWGIISIYYGKIPLSSIPMLTLCKRHGNFLSIAYSTVLFMAMLTTALANAFTVSDAISFEKRFKIVFISVLGFFFAAIPFDFFVGGIYRLAGCIGTGFMIWIIIKSKKNKILRKKT